MSVPVDLKQLDLNGRTVAVQLVDNYTFALGKELTKLGVCHEVEGG